MQRKEMHDGADQADRVLACCSVDGNVTCTVPENINFLKIGDNIFDLIKKDRKTDPVFHGSIKNMPFSFYLMSLGGTSFYIGMSCCKKETIDIVKQLEKANMDLEAIFESSHDGIVVADENGVFIRVNSSYERITGTLRTDVIGRSAKDIIKGGVVSDSATLQVLRTNMPYTFSQTSRSGRQSVVTGSPVHDANGAIVRVVTNVRDMTEINNLREELTETKNKVTKYAQLFGTISPEDDIVFQSETFGKILQDLAKFANADAPLLITGESGVGKEVLADFAYRRSPRKDQPFLKINCAAFPGDLLESELFGYEGGAFTGARKEGRPGLLELASGGTVMLDEIGELPPTLQAKLLRFTQQKEFYRLGGKKLIHVDVRLIAATNRDLQSMIEAKLFRSDLFFRLNVLRVDVPPLRERPEDIVPLAKFLLAKFNKKYNVSKRITGEVYQRFARYPWFGNVRELENAIERIVILCDEDEISSRYLPASMKASGLDAEPLMQEETYKEARDAFEKEFLGRALEKYGSTRHAAQKIGVDHSTIVKKAARYGLKLLPRSSDLAQRPPEKA